MSEELKSENENLKQQLSNNTQGINSLVAQLEAHKQSLNDSLNLGLQLRTNLIMFQKANKELTDSLATQKQQIDSLSQQLEDATNRIAMLQTPPVRA